MVKLSVVVVTYAPYHKYLPLVLGSIDFTPAINVEIIVVNDSPEAPIASDGTLVVLNRTNGIRWGAGGARNKGAAIAKGEALVFVDGDDILIPGALNKMWAVYEKTGHVVYGDLLRSDMNEVWHTKPQYRGDDIKESPLFVEKSAMPYLALIPKTAHEQIGGYVTEDQAITWEDLIYEADLWANGVPCEHIDVVTYVYRWTTTGRRAISEDLTVRKTVSQFMYNRYSEFHMGLKKAPFGEKGEKSMPCNTCGGKSTRTTTSGGYARSSNFNSPIPQARTLPSPDTWETLYLEYTGENPTRTYLGPVTRLQYRFGHNQRIRRRAVVNKEPQWIDPKTEIHVEDARQLYAIVRRGGSDFKAYTEIQAEVLNRMATDVQKMPSPVSQPTPPVFQPADSEEEKVSSAPLSITTPIGDFTISAMGEFLDNTPVAQFQLEVWLMEERAGKNRKGMIDLLESRVVPIT